MTTFTDREHAMEAHHAYLELAAFRERLHRYKELGRRVASRLGLEGDSAERFALDLAERFSAEPANDSLCSRVAAEFSRYNLHLSKADLRRLALAEDSIDSISRVVAPPRRSWIEFVISQVLMLFGVESTPTDVSPDRMAH